jgi:hypothetical protein
MTGVATIVVTLVLYLTLDSGGSNAHHGPRRALFKSYSRAEDGLFAKRVASRMRDNTPKEIEIVNSTRTRALRVISPEERVVDESSGDVAVRVFAMHGKFTHIGSVPRDESSPQGTWLTLAVDKDTGQLLDLSLTDERPKLSILGKVQRIG